MTMMLSPDLGVPLSDDVPYLDLRERAAAACATIEELQDHGLETESVLKDRAVATALATSYAANPEKTSKTVNTQRAAKLTPASLLATRAILDEWGHAVVNHAIEIRHTVTNKLIHESDNPDPRVRIRALELLGKISDVGLFSEKHEVTVTHQSTDDLRAKLREKLDRLMRPEQEIEDVVMFDGEAINVAEELGLPEDEELPEELKKDE